MTLTEFLHARLAEDEAGASAETITIPQHGALSSPPEVAFGAYGPVSEWDRNVWEEYISALERHHPECIGPANPRMLAEVDAKRRIIEAHETGDIWCDIHCVLRLLAIPYQDHEEFRDEWRAE